MWLFFTVNKIGKQIDAYYVNKALQLYLEGLSYREIERILGISHVSILNWVKNIILSVLIVLNTILLTKYSMLKNFPNYFSEHQNLIGAGVVVTELGDKFMLIRWERFKD